MHIWFIVSPIKRHGRKQRCAVWQWLSIISPIEPHKLKNKMPNNKKCKSKQGQKYVNLPRLSVKVEIHKNYNKHGQMGIPCLKPKQELHIWSPILLLKFAILFCLCLDTSLFFHISWLDKIIYECDMYILPIYLFHHLFL